MAIDPGLRRLILRTVLAAFPGTTLPHWTEQLLADGLAGVTLFGQNLGEPAQVAALTGALRAAHRDVLVAIDEEGGDVARLAHVTGSPYPGNAALGVVDDPALTRRIYRAIGTELAGVGVNLNFAPTVDVNVVADNPSIGTRSFGPDQTRVTVHTVAAVEGLQETGVAACAKHFPGHGASTADSHLTLPTVDVTPELLRSRDLPPFAAAIEAGVKAVLTAHIRVPYLTGDDPATFSPAALVDLLRHEYGFTGALVTDALDMVGATSVAGGLPAAAARSLAAGADLLCLGSQSDPGLAEEVVAAVAGALAHGALTRSRLEQAAERAATLAAAVRVPAVPVPPASEPGIAELGYDAARRAIRVEGSLAGLASGVDPFVVQFESGPSIAEGPAPWGLAPHVTGVLRVDAGQTSAEQLGALAGDRPVIVVGRHLHRCSAARALVEKLVTDHPTVVAEMGWPSAWRPAGAEAFVTTHGASLANGVALARLLHLH